MLNKSDDKTRTGGQSRNNYPSYTGSCYDRIERYQKFFKKIFFKPSRYEIWIKPRDFKFGRNTRAKGNTVQ